jgi:carboxyl-terminal processing protease
MSLFRRRSSGKWLAIGLGSVALLGSTFGSGLGTAYVLSRLPREDGPSSVGEGRRWLGISPPWRLLAAPLESSTVCCLVRDLLPIRVPSCDDDQSGSQIVWEVWDRTRESFYGDIPSTRDVSYAAIRGMLETLEDEYTAFLEPEVATVLAEEASGEYDGIGAYVSMNDAGQVVITGLLAGGPAEQAGLLPLDRLISVDGVSLVGDSLYEAIGLLRGPRGSEVVIGVERDGEGELIEVVAKRARLVIPVVSSRMLEESIGYLRLSEFSAKSADHLTEALEQLLGEGAQAMILDLRQNPGGWLDQAIEVADQFVDEGVIVLERTGNEQEQVYRAVPGQVGEAIPMVVLIDEGSASASEIVAGALQDHERATLIGQRTFGKGSVQRPFALSDGSELRVTIARWFTPNERAVQGSGITPDILWPRRPIETDVDSQLERAIRYFQEGYQGGN